MNELERLVESARARVAERRRQVPLSQLERAAESRPQRASSFLEALRAPRLSLIAEHKRSSPSAGLIRAGLALEEVVAAYERGGAAALSILTEPTRFGGSLEDIAAARGATSLPILRKDFIVDRYQLYESHAAGADAILLIVAALGEEELKGLLQAARELGLAALVEIHDEHELELAAGVGVGAEVIGINNRDLTTLEVDTERTFRLLPELPPGAIKVAESGFHSREQLDRLAQAGADAVLIGEALMRSGDIEAAVRELVQARD